MNYRQPSLGLQVQKGLGTDVVLRLCVAMLTDLGESKQANVGCGMVVDAFARFETLQFGISAPDISEDVYF